MNEKEIFKVISGDDLKGKKLLLYKFFFFNYMLSVTIPEIISSVFHHQHSKEQINALNNEEEQKVGDVAINEE
jgi:hypothetical protein